MLPRMSLRELPVKTVENFTPYIVLEVKLATKPASPPREDARMARNAPRLDLLPVTRRLDAPHSSKTKLAAVMMKYLEQLFSSLLL